MTYAKPPAFSRHLVKPLVSRLGTGGVATLTVVGRRTAQPHTVPVTPVEADGVSYLVSPFGESEWVRNLRKAGVGQLGRKAGTQSFRAEELPVSKRPPVIAAYRSRGRRDVDPHFTPGCPIPRIIPCSVWLRRTSHRRHTGVLPEQLDSFPRIRCSRRSLR